MGRRRRGTARLEIGAGTYHSHEIAQSSTSWETRKFHAIVERYGRIGDDLEIEQRSIRGGVLSEIRQNAERTVRSYFRFLLNVMIRPLDGSNDRKDVGAGIAHGTYDTGTRRHVCAVPGQGSCHANACRQCRRRERKNEQSSANELTHSNVPHEILTSERPRPVPTRQRPPGFCLLPERMTLPPQT